VTGNVGLFGAEADAIHQIGLKSQEERSALWCSEAVIMEDLP